MVSPSITLPNLRTLAACCALLAGLSMTHCDKVRALVDKAQDCPGGQHRSDGHCCPMGEEWVPSKSSCVCLDKQACEKSATLAAQPAITAAPAEALPGTPQPTPTAAVATPEHDNTPTTPTEAVAGMDAPTPPPPCKGTWRGRIKYTADHRDDYEGMGEVRITKPRSKRACGSLRERWSDGRCNYDIVDCKLKGRRLSATAKANGKHTCQPVSSLSLSCNARSVSYTRREGAYTSYGKLTKR